MASLKSRFLILGSDGLTTMSLIIKHFRSVFYISVPHFILFRSVRLDMADQLLHMMRIPDDKFQGVQESKSHISLQKCFIYKVGFCYEPLENALNRMTVDVANRYWPKDLKCPAGSRAIPSAHHRFLYFSAHCSVKYPTLLDTFPHEAEGQPRQSGGITLISKVLEPVEKSVPVWGIIERVGDAAQCILYSEDNVGQRHNVKVYTELFGTPTNQRLRNVHQLFCVRMGAAWKGDYDAKCNNCIDYAIECWNLLAPQCSKPKVEWNDVCMKVNDIADSVL